MISWFIALNTFQKFWVFWIAAFIVVEGIAVFNGQPNDTLSEFVWMVIGTYVPAEDRTFLMWIWRAGVLALLAWLIPHLMTGWRWFRRNKK